MDEHDDGHLDDRTRQWVQQQADDDVDGHFATAAAAILEAAHAAELAPQDPWAGIKARVHRQTHRLMQVRSQP